MYYTLVLDAKIKPFEQGFFSPPGLLTEAGRLLVIEAVSQTGSHGRTGGRMTRRSSSRRRRGSDGALRAFPPECRNRAG